MSTTQLDQSRADAFAETLLGIVNSATLSLMISVGHRTGLFDTLAGMTPVTSAELAAKAGLQERYVREWLGAMASGRIVEYDEKTGRYRLPAEHAACLTRAAAANNMASMMQWVSVLGGVEDRIVECFKNGGGVPYEAYHRFHEVMAEESAQTVVGALHEHILPLVDGLDERLTHGGAEALDIGCGRGHAVQALARAYPQSRFAGYDLSREATGAARREAEAAGIPNARFEARDVTRLGEPARYDLITAFDAIHDQKDPAAVLREIAASLKPDGVFLMQDIDASSKVHENVGKPLASLLYSISCMHCMTVSLAQGGAGLGTVWGVDTAERMLRDAGFTKIEVKRLPHDIMNAYFVARK